VESRYLGHTGVRVSRLILGCAGFGGLGSSLDLVGRGESERTAFHLMDTAWELGIRTFDTADAYAGGRSELMIGRWIKAREVRPTLTTKTFHPMEPGADSGLSRTRIRRQVEGSLTRLGVDRIDLYLTHQPDEATPIDETLETLDQLVEEGAIGAYGGSHLTAELLQLTQERYGWVQNEFSLLEQRDVADVLPLVEELGIGYTPYSPLAGGWLTGKYRRGVPPPPGSRMSLRPEPYQRFEKEPIWQSIAKFCRRAAAVGAEPMILAYAWVLSEPRVTAIIVGPRERSQLLTAVESLEYAMTTLERAELAEIFGH